MSESKFKPHKYECAKCHGIINSSYPGEFVRCKCGAICVDETLHYTRLIGASEDFLEVK